MILPQEFYDRPTKMVAQELLGKVLVHVSGRKKMSVMIREVEAYIGEDDPACHAARGITPRTKIMYGAPGHAYVYFIYGMYFCLNVVTEKSGYPAAVLIRGGQPIDGLEYIQKNRKGRLDLDGPGKLCQGLGINLNQNGLDVTKGSLAIEDRGLRLSKNHIRKTPRIGIRVGQERLWRYVWDTDGDTILDAQRQKNDRGTSRVRGTD